MKTSSKGAKMPDMSRPSVYTMLREWAELGAASAVHWFASFPDNYGRRTRRGYVTISANTRDARAHAKTMIEYTREFKAWFTCDLGTSAWSFDMHDIPDFESLGEENHNA